MDGWADVPVPARLLNPASVEEAWNVIRLATANVERLLAEQRLDEVTGQMVLCSPAIRLLAANGVALEKQAETDANTAQAFSRINLVARESMAGNQVGAENVFGEFKKGLKLLEGAFNAAAVKGEVYACLEHPESVAMVAETKCGMCARTRVARRIPYSGIYVKPGEPTIRWELKAGSKLEQGKEVKLMMTVKGVDGAPVTLPDLVPTHGAGLHLILVDQGWTDFQHVLPVAGKSAGDYEVAFTPKSDAGYSAWLGVVPVATGLQEYLKAELDGGVENAVVQAGDNGEVMKCVVEGYTFQMSFFGVGKVRKGQTRLMRIQVTDTAGQPVTQLEPMRMAFAHVAGFYEGGETMLELHPQGGDVLDASLRYGPTLAFKFYPPQAGSIRLFCEVKVGGRFLTPAFLVSVEE
jgi:hypothetical protein